MPQRKAAAKPKSKTAQKTKDTTAAKTKGKDYAAKRVFDKTPEPTPEVAGNVDPGTAPPGKTFVIHQHYARRLHFDLRLEMMNGDVPVLVSWAVPKNLPVKKGVRTLAIHVEDHPFEYGSFSGAIPKGEYGAGEVRIFDAGTYEMLDQKQGKLTFRLDGKRLNAEFHLIKTARGGEDQWLAMLREDLRPRPDEMPPFEPMLATLVNAPFDDEAWAFEPKWDGVRAIAICDEGTRLISRNEKDITVAYPELHELNRRLVAIDAILDGEIVAMEEGRPSFERLQSRMHVRNPKDIERLAKTTPVSYVVFDLLYLDGRSLVGLPLEERRMLLEETVVPSEFVQLSPWFKGKGVSLFEAARAQNLEGIVAKKLSSKYEVGHRGKNWLKVKTIFDADLVIGGWTPGQGGRSGKIGSLHLGAYRDGELVYVGAVGTGFDSKSLVLVQSALDGLEEDHPPFVEESLSGEKPQLRHARWVRPELVATVEFRELTSAGKLRAPSFKGLRKDVGPKECTFEALEVAAGRL
jgi:bifunctional non-homologous end joining protein LigD